MSSPEAIAVWTAVDRLTQPSSVDVERAVEAEWLLTELGDDMFGLRHGRRDQACSVPAYRAAMARKAAGTSRHATIPSLWDQATVALTTGSEGGTGSTPLRERSPADLDLMEIRSLIRDTVTHELKQREPRPPVGDVPFQIRHLASIVTRDDTDHLWWWEYRFAQWARLLETYLHAMEHKPKPTRLRNAACPLCKTRQMTVEQDGEMIVVPPLLVEFRDGYIRAAKCEKCSATWFRGAELHELARLIGATPTELTA